MCVQRTLSGDFNRIPIVNNIIITEVFRVIFLILYYIRFNTSYIVAYNII